MINKTLYSKMIKSNYKLILIFIAILSMYMFVIIDMYDPNNLEIMDELLELKLSKELLQAMGFTLSDSTLLGFISSYLYGFLMLAVPMICYIIFANKLVAALVEKGSMAYILSTPNTRRKVATTQGAVLLTSITILIVFITILGIIICENKFPGLLDINGFIFLNLGLLILHFAISGICFFASCIFNESKYSFLVGAGLPVIFLLIEMLSNVGGKLEKFKNFTIFTLFNPMDIIHKNNVLIPMSILAFITIVLYILAVKIFDRRNLPI